MTTTLPNRAQIDAAEPLTFPNRKPEILIAVKAQLDGFPVELSFTGAVDQLPAIVKRLRELGAEPVGAPVHTAPIGNGKPKAQPPFYNGDGDACCPTHTTRTLRGPNQWGKLYCSARDGDAYCKYTWKAE